METYRKEDIRRGDIYYADLSPVVGSEQGGIRPVVILQNNVGNRHSPTVIAAAITSRKGKHKLPTHVNMDAPVPGLYRDSIILLEQLRTIDKSRLRGKVGSLGEGQMCKLDHALEVSVGLLPLFRRRVVRRLLWCFFVRIVSIFRRCPCGLCLPRSP